MAANAQDVTYSYLAQAAYDAYDHGACRYPLHHLLPALGLDGLGYVTTQYLYATVNSIINGVDHEHRQHWIGYVAVARHYDADSFRDIVVVWRGTSTPSELFKDLQAFLVSIHGEGAAPPPQHPVMVERGFQSLYVSSCDGSGTACEEHGRFSARSRVLNELRRLVTHFGKEHPGDKIRVTATGHSLGGALAMLAARDAAEMLSSSGGGVQVRVVTFGAPRVGNEAFRDELASRGVTVRRVILQQDFVPSIPPTYLGYADVGEVVPLDEGSFATAPYLTWIALWHFHCLKRYLRLLDLNYVDTPVPPPEPADGDVLPVPEAELDGMIYFQA
ncbi:unnamed protein product [Urochloa humidicola]